jgi:hypothetical protein
MMVSRKTHLTIAAILWGLVGFGLLMAGLFFLFGNRGMGTLPGQEAGIGTTELIALIVAVLLGGAKGKFVITKVGKKNRARIESLPEVSPVYTTFSGKSWVMVLGMILLGRLIRLGGASPVAVGAIYVAVGVALLIGSRVYLQDS